MGHSLKVTVTKEQKPGGLMAARTVSIREKILRFFLGDIQRAMVLVPGDCICDVVIREDSPEA